MQDPHESPEGEVFHIRLLLLNTLNDSDVSLVKAIRKSLQRVFDQLISFRLADFAEVVYLQVYPKKPVLQSASLDFQARPL